MFAPFPAGVEFTMDEAQAAAASMRPLPEHMGASLSLSVANLVPTHAGIPLSETPDLPGLTADVRDPEPGTIGKLKLKRILAKPSVPKPPAGVVAGAPAEGALGSGGAPPLPPRPVLLDVTPHALSIATVGGYAETVIARNSPIPIEQKRVFGTARSGQRTVRILVLQGDSNLIDACSSLGELVLEELPETAKRGEVKIDVIFEVNPDGILSVRAIDSNTGREQKTTLSIAGNLDDDTLDGLLLAPEA